MEISQTVKNFMVQFENNVVPHLNQGEVKLGMQLVTCYVSAATLQDPQLKELLGIKPGTTNGKFMGVTVIPKPDMTIETFYKEGEK